MGDIGTADIEKALTINPKDLLAVAFYPVFLGGTKRFEELKKVTTPLLKEEGYKYYAFMMLYMNALFIRMDKGVDLKTISLESFIDTKPYDKYFKGSDKIIRFLRLY